MKRLRLTAGKGGSEGGKKAARSFVTRYPTTTTAAPLLVIKVAAFSASARSRKNILAPPFTKVCHFGGSCLSKARNDVNSLIPT